MYHILVEFCGPIDLFNNPSWVRKLRIVFGIVSQTMILIAINEIEYVCVIVIIKQIAYVYVIIRPP